MLTISPACLVLHTRVKLHQHKHLQKFWLTLFICYVYDVQCTWSDGRRLKSAGGFVITYRLLEESAEVSFLSRNLAAKNSLDLLKLEIFMYNFYKWSNCYYSKQMLLFLVEVTNKIKDSEDLFIIRIIYCV